MLDQKDDITVHYTRFNDVFKITTLQLRVGSFVYYLIEPFFNNFVNLHVVIVDSVKPNITL